MEKMPRRDCAERFGIDSIQIDLKYLFTVKRRVKLSADAGGVKIEGDPREI